MPRFISRAVLGCAWLLSVVTHAQQVPPVPAVQLERLTLNPSQNGSTVVGTGALLAEKELRLSGVMHYENNPLLAYDEQGRLGSVVRDRLTLHLSGAFAVKPRIEVGLQVPVIVAQGGDDLTAAGIGRPASGGLGTPLASVRYSLITPDPSGAASVIGLSAELVLGVPVGSKQAMAQDAGLMAAPSMLGSLALGPVNLSGQFGLLLRPAARLGTTTVGSELTWAVAGSAPIRDKWRAELAFRSGISLTGAPNTSEVLAGARYTIMPNVQAFGFVGPGLGRSPGTPAFRFLTGLTFGKKPALDRPLPIAQPETPEQPPEETPTVSTSEEDNASPPEAKR